jgi:hypothetical protein
MKLLYVLLILCVGVWQLQQQAPLSPADQELPDAGSSQVAEALEQLPIKGRAPKTGYSRKLFYDTWANVEVCDIRNFVLARDMSGVVFVPGTCKVASGILNDPYTGKSLLFTRGAETSDAVQIDHVVSLSDAWQKGAQQLLPLERYAFANDPLNLLAVDGQANQNKGDSDAASWVPPDKSYRCSYVARQVAVKHKYALWVTTAEYQAIARILVTCPDQRLPTT